MLLLTESSSFFVEVAKIPPLLLSRLFKTVKVISYYKTQKSPLSQSRHVFATLWYLWRKGTPYAHKLHLMDALLFTLIKGNLIIKRAPGPHVSNTKVL